MMAGAVRHNRKMEKPKIVSAEEWQQARGELLTAEKEATRALDAIAARRRRPHDRPWERRARRRRGGWHSKGGARITSRLVRSADLSPADMPTSVVRKTLMAASTTLGLSPPKTMFRIGAMAMIGMQ